MKITSIHAKASAHKLPCHFHGSNYSYTHKKIMTVHAETDAGICGYCYLGDDFGLGALIVQKLNTDIAPLLIGRNPLELEDIWNDLRPLARDILGDRRIGLHAQALADIVCWDIRGKAAEKPLAKLLGGAHPSLPAVAIAGYYAPDKTLDDLAAETRELISIGCGGMKLKVGGVSLQEDIERVKTVRQAGGDGFLLAVDANQSWSLAQAQAFADAVADQDLLWIEEPVHWDNDIADMAALRRITDIPICAGQSEWTVAGLKRLIDAGAVDICNLHPGYCGGVTPWLQAAELARENGLGLANTGEPQLSSHLMLAFANSLCIEIYHPDRDPVFIKHCPVYAERSQGHFPMPELSGWGVV